MPPVAERPPDPDAVADEIAEAEAQERRSAADDPADTALQGPVPPPCPDPDDDARR